MAEIMVYSDMDPSSSMVENSITPMDDEEAYDSFEAMNLKEDLLKSLHKYGYKKPSNVQQRGIVPLCKGRDVILQAKTEPGKIATYCTGILQQINCSVFKCQSIILAPGDVAVDEIARIMRALGDSLGVKVFVCGKEEDSLSAGVHVVVGTRDRVLKLLKEKKLSSDEFRMLVLDEADLILESEYIRKQVYDILDCLREQTRNKIQVSAFSETMPTKIIQKTSELMTDPLIILAKDLGEEELTLDGIKKHQFVEVKNAEEKQKVLLQLLFNNVELKLLPAIIIVHNPQMLAILTEKMTANGYKFSATRKGMNQIARDEIAQEFLKSGVLISTGRWVRGIEILQQVRSVVITETCYQGEYLRCIGWLREVNTAISFATPDDWEWLIDLQEMYKVVFEKLTPKLIEKPNPSKFPVLSRLTPRVFSKLTPSKLTQESPKKWRALENKHIKHVLYNSEDDDGKFSALVELLPKLLIAAKRCIIIVNTQARKDRLIKSMQRTGKYRIVTTINALIKQVGSGGTITRPCVLITTEKDMNIKVQDSEKENIKVRVPVVISYDLCLTWEQYDRRASWCAEKGVIINLAAKEDWSMVFDIQSMYNVVFAWLPNGIPDHLARLTKVIIRVRKY